MPNIFDNIDQILLPALKGSFNAAYRADFCVGYFNLRGWKQLDSCIEAWSGDENNCCRVIVGMNKSIDTELREALSLELTERVTAQVANRFKNQLAETFRKQLTLGAPSNEDEAGLRRLMKQLRDGKLQVRLFTSAPLHAKLYLLFRNDPDLPIKGYLGSSNLTFAGLSKNFELNVDVVDSDATQKLANWFQDRWEDRFCIDITNELAAIIEESWASEQLIKPYYVYLKMAYHLSREARDGLREYEIPANFGATLFEFQSAAVKIAAHHLNRRGGVLIGDVVGFGKTLMATALARIIEDTEYISTLIICPKNLEKMWNDYVIQYGLRAMVLPITQVQQKIQDIPARFRLVIIDESHNLKNREGKRYQAIHEYIQQSGSKVVLLSATPYNKSYTDLSSQLRLFVAEDQDLGIRPETYIQSLGGDVFYNAEHSLTPIRSIGAFEHSQETDDWRELMRLYLVRRTRSFIKENYAKADESGRKYLEFADGKRNYFPERIPKTVRFTIDDNNPQDQYARLYSTDVVEIIGNLSLPRYGLGNYVNHRPKISPTASERQQIENLSRAGKRLMGFSRTNLFKRLESSGHAFLQSVERHILRNYIFVHAIENGLELPIGTQDADMLDTRNQDEDDSAVGTLTNLFSDEREDDETELIDAEVNTQWSEQAFIKRAAEVYQNYKNQYRRRFKWLRSDLFVRQLANDLKDDAEALTTILKLAGQWDASEDGKLRALYELLTETYPIEKVLIFSQFADTVRYLEEQLLTLDVDQLAGVTGGDNDPTQYAWRFSPKSNDKGDPKKSGYVSKSNELRILIATDVLSEGQNLQDAHVVVNYDLPWAIIRLIQRVGRVDRIGQASEKIYAHTFLPAEGIERIIKLRERVSNRLRQNAEVIGTDEVFFDDDTQQATLLNLYNEKANLLDDDVDDDVDLASYAFQIWKNATDRDPSLEQKIPQMQPVTFATRPHIPKPEKPAGALMYMQTADGRDALAWVDQAGNSVTESQFAILQAAACAPETPALERQENHHDLVRRGVNRMIQENQGVSGGQLGRKSSVRYRTYMKLKAHLEHQAGHLFAPELSAALEEIYKYPLYASARDILNARLNAGLSDDDLADLVLSLRQDDRLCIIHDEDDKQEPQIICSLGLAVHKGSA
jgi:superfamily II DNA or RNA helicase